MTTQLTLYNGACLLLGQTQLQTLEDQVEVRFLLDGAWVDAIQACLEQGQWFFAMRTSRFDNDPDIAPAFGLQYVFDKPADWVRTAGLCSDEFFKIPLTQGEAIDEAGFWYAYCTPIYARYVSNGPDYGANMGAWPTTFARFFEAYLAQRVCRAVTKSEEKVQEIMKEYKRLLTDARSKAAMNEGAAFPPVGTWVRSRRGRAYGYDGGVQNQLIG
jgi:hypothetical protein